MRVAREHLSLRQSLPFRIGLAIAALTLAASFADAKTVVRVHGATTTMAALVGPHRHDVERALDIELKLDGNGTGRGLADLVADRVDLALTAEPLNVAISAAEVAGASLKAADYRLIQVDEQEVQVIVNPANPVSALTWAQLRDIHLGKITDWSELGGPNRSIVVYIDAPAGGTRALIKHVLLNDQEYSFGCRALDSVIRVAENVASNTWAIGIVGATFVDQQRMKVVTTKKMMRPIGFITKGEPTPEQTRIIDEYRKFIKK